MCNAFDYTRNRYLLFDVNAYFNNQEFHIEDINFEGNKIVVANKQYSKIILIDLFTHEIRKVIDVPIAGSGENSIQKCLLITDDTVLLIFKEKIILWDTLLGPIYTYLKKELFSESIFTNDPIAHTYAIATLHYSYDLSATRIKIGTDPLFARQILELQPIIDAANYKKRLFSVSREHNENKELLKHAVLLAAIEKAGKANIPFYLKDERNDLMGIYKNIPLLIRNTMKDVVKRHDVEKLTPFTFDFDTQLSEIFSENLPIVDVSFMEEN